MTARDKILAFLASFGRPIPIHEITIPGVSQTSASARLREMARAGLVTSVPVKGKRFTAWKIRTQEERFYDKPYWAGEK